MSARELLEKGALELGIELGDDQTELFMLYLKELKYWNQKINLTALKEEQDIIIKHFLDSITPAYLIESGTKLLDIGSGAGFPGVPLKIIRPELDVTLLESSGKKATFLKELIRKLGLELVTVVSQRAEDNGNGVSRNSFDFVVTRAVGSVPHVLSLSIPYVKEGGSVLLMRGRKGALQTETSEYPSGATLVAEEHITLPISGDERTLLLFKSVSS